MWSGVLAIMLVVMSVGRVSCQSTFFIAETTADISAFPTAPRVSTVVVHQREYFARFTNEYRLVERLVEGESHFLYCRIPSALSLSELEQLKEQQVENNTELRAHTRIAIFEFLSTMSCMTAVGDKGYRTDPDNVHTYRYCPFGELRRLVEVSSPSLGSHDKFTDEDEDNARDEETRRSLEATWESSAAASELLGVFEEGVSDVQWDSRRKEWSMSLGLGGPCRRGEHSVAATNYSAVVKFRCHRASVDEEDGLKNIWVVSEDSHSCVVAVEFETAAVCRWHGLLEDLHRCPIPCISVL